MKVSRSIIQIIIWCPEVALPESEVLIREQKLRELPRVCLNQVQWLTAELDDMATPMVVYICAFEPPEEQMVWGLSSGYIPGNARSLFSNSQFTGP